MSSNAVAPSASPPVPTAPLHVLVTAGPTREKIDAVRDWGNIFTGRTGLDLALAFLELGNVTLLTSNAEHVRAYDGYSAGRGMIGAELFHTHADLRDLLAERMTGGDRVDVVAMTAAVSDYTPAGTYRIVSRVPCEKLETRNSKLETETWHVERVDTGVGAGKVKSHFDEIAFLAARTPKLIDMFRRDWNFRGILIKFKLEVGLTDEELLRVAGESRLASGADLMVANTLAMARPKKGEGAAYLLDGRGSTRVARSQLAGAVQKWIKGHLSRV